MVKNYYPMSTEGHKQKRRLLVQKQKVPAKYKYILAQMQKTQSDTHIQDAYCDPNLFTLSQTT